MAPFGVCGPGTEKEWCGNFDREKKLATVCGALGVSDGVRAKEDHPHELPHVRCVAESNFAPSCVLPAQ